MLLLLQTYSGYSQAGQKFSVFGNILSDGNFFGSTNNQALLVKVNNALALQINPGGSILMNCLASAGNGLVSFDNTIDFHGNNNPQFYIFDLQSFA